MSIEDRLRSLIELEAQQSTEVERLKAELDEAKAALQRTQRETLPAVLREAGLTAAEVPGARVSMTADCELSIPKEARWDAMQWLEREGHGGLLRRRVIAMPRDDDMLAAAEVALLGAGTDEVVREVALPHYQTLRAFGREALATGIELPPELFKIHPFDVTKITRR